MRGIEVEGAIGAEDKGHVTDAFAVRNFLGVQRDMDGCRVVMMLSFTRNVSTNFYLLREPTHINDPALRVTRAHVPHMSKDKIILALPPPARIFLLIFKIFLPFSPSGRGGDNVGKGAGGVVRVTRAG
jgi:hypothetical protein